MSARLYLQGADFGRVESDAEADGENVRLVICDERLNSASFLLSREEAQEIIDSLTNAMKDQA